MPSTAPSQGTLAVSKFSLERPTSDDAMSAEAEFQLANPTGELIRWFKLNATVLDSSGYPLGCSNDNVEECSIGPGERLVHRVWMHRLTGCKSARGPSDLTLVGSTTLFAREYFKIGELDVPVSSLGSATIQTSISSETIEGPLRAIVVREPADDDGDMCLVYRVSVRNMTDVHLGRVIVKAVVLDAEDSPVSESESEDAIGARCMRCIEGSTSSMKVSQYRGARLRMSLAVFRPVHSATCSHSSAPRKRA